MRLVRAKSTKYLYEGLSSESSRTVKLWEEEPEAAPAATPVSGTPAKDEMLFNKTQQAIAKLGKSDAEQLVNYIDSLNKGTSASSDFDSVQQGITKLGKSDAEQLVRYIDSLSKDRTAPQKKSDIQKKYAQMAVDRMGKTRRENAEFDKLNTIFENIVKTTE